MVLQATISPEKESCNCYPEVLEKLQNQEVLLGHQERLLQTAGSHQIQSSDQQVLSGPRDDRETSGEMSGLPCEEVPAEGEVGRAVPPEAGEDLAGQQEREETAGNI